MTARSEKFDIRYGYGTFGSCLPAVAAPAAIAVAATVASGTPHKKKIYIYIYAASYEHGAHKG